MTTLPAVVTIADLALVTTLSSSALIEVVQTSPTGDLTSYQASIAQVMTTALGGLPTSGATGQLLGKSSGTDYASEWVNLSDRLSGTSGIAVAGSTTLTVAIDTTAGLSVLGVAGAGSAIPAAIVGAASQFLGVSAGGTTQFQVINLGTAASFTGVLTVAFGGSGTSSLTANAVLLGAGTATFGLVAAATAGLPLVAQGTTTAPAYQALNLGSSVSVTGVLTVPFGGVGLASYAAGDLIYASDTTTLARLAAVTTGLPLVAQGTSTAPAYQALNLASAVSFTGLLPMASLTGVLTVPFGGSGATTLTANAVLLGAGTATLAFAAPGTAGNILISQGSTSDPAFQIVSGDFTLGAAGTATIATGAVTFAKFASGTGLAVFAYNSTVLGVATAVVGTANQVLAINPGATAIIWTSLTPIESMIIACSNQTGALTAGTAVVTFRMPYAFTLNEVRASLSSAQTTGSVLTVDINENGTSVLSTLLTIDNTEETSVTAATAAVISDSSLADDSEITIDIDQAGQTAAGLKVVLIGRRA